MRPHPLFEGRSIPAVHRLGEVMLKALSVADLERDYNAVLASAADIQGANPGSSWPDGLTKQKNLIDLAWHQREFEARRSFAWVIESTDENYLGCLYVYPSIAGKPAADVNWWWRTGAVVSRHAFREHLLDWLSSSDWPRIAYILPAD